jgi:hypothetical protein
MAEHERTRTAFNDNRERLRSERLAREAADPAGGKLVMPTPQLPDDTPIDKLRLTTRMREALHPGEMPPLSFAASADQGGGRWNLTGEVRDEKIHDDDDRGAKTQKYHAR